MLRTRKSVTDYPTQHRILSESRVWLTVTRTCVNKLLWYPLEPSLARSDTAMYSPNGLLSQSSRVGVIRDKIMVQQMTVQGKVESVQRPVVRQREHGLV